MAARYTPLSHEDSDDEASPQDGLLQSPQAQESQNSDDPTTWSGTLNPALVLHLASLIMTIIAIIVFIVGGGVTFIATDIFLAFILIIDFVTIAYSTISDVFKITVELRNGAWRTDISGFDRANVAPYVDFIITFCLFICLTTGTVIAANSYGDTWIAGSVFGYLVILTHLLLAITAIHKNYLTLTLTAKVTPSKGKTARVKRAREPSGMTADSDAGAASRSNMEDAEQRQPVDDLV